MRVEKTGKDQDAKYKIKESTNLEQNFPTVLVCRQKFDVVSEYLTKIDGECIAEAEAYEARKAHRVRDS